jgi:REP element-mobilizing transposase RayT
LTAAGLHVIALINMNKVTKGTRGGKREGAGRKASPFRRHDPPHRARPGLSHRHPVHVVLRTADGVRRLRQGVMYRAIRGVLHRYLGHEDFRVVHISIQHNHLHLLVEAADRQVLTRRMQSFAINAARAINGTDGRRGKVFAYRYHATQIRTPRQARCAFAYVLNNWRHHREDLVMGRAFEAAVDPYSSGLSFTGWKGRRFLVPVGYSPLPVTPPATALLRSQWTRFGRIDAFECPGPARF